MEAAGQACADGHPAHDAVPSRPVGPSPAPRPPPAPGRGRHQLRARRRGRGGRGEGRREGGFLPPHTQSPSRIYRVSRLGAERQEQLPRGRSTSRSPGEGPGFRGPLVEPAPRRRSRYSGSQPGRASAHASAGEEPAGVAGRQGSAGSAERTRQQRGPAAGWARAPVGSAERARQPRGPAAGWARAPAGRRAVSAALPRSCPRPPSAILPRLRRAGRRHRPPRWGTRGREGRACREPADWANLGAAPRPRARGNRRRPGLAEASSAPGAVPGESGATWGAVAALPKPWTVGARFPAPSPIPGCARPDPPTRASPGTEPQAEKGRSGPGAAGARSVPIRSFPPLPEGPGRLRGSRGAGTRFQLV